MRLRRLARVSLVASAALLLAGCAAGAPNASGTSSPSASSGDLCSAAAAPGDASNAVTVTGTPGTEGTATFTAPLNVPQLERTVISEGSGDPVRSGQLVSYALTAFNAQTGEKMGSIGYNEGETLPVAISADNPLGQVIGCAKPGSRMVATFPASENGPGEVYVFDFLKTVPNAAWGTPQAPVDGMPTVTLDDSGKPTVQIPSGDAPTEVKIADLKTGDGPVVASGDKVLVQYEGVLWSDGTEFDSSWSRGEPASFQTTGVVPGFQQALEGQKVGSQVLVVVPPAFGYKDQAQGKIPANSTLVFVIDILGTQHASAAQ